MPQMTAQDLLLVSGVVRTAATPAASAKVSRGRRTAVRKHGSRRPPPPPPCPPPPRWWPMRGGRRREEARIGSLPCFADHGLRRARGRETLGEDNNTCRGCRQTPIPRSDHCPQLFFPAPSLNHSRRSSTRDRCARRRVEGREEALSDGSAS